MTVTEALQISEKLLDAGLLFSGNSQREEVQRGKCEVDQFSVSQILAADSLDHLQGFVRKPEASAGTSFQGEQAQLLVGVRHVALKTNSLVQRKENDETALGAGCCREGQHGP